MWHEQMNVNKQMNTEIKVSGSKSINKWKLITE